MENPQTFSELSNEYAKKEDLANGVVNRGRPNCIILRGFSGERNEKIAGLLIPWPLNKQCRSEVVLRHGGITPCLSYTNTRR